MEPILFAFFILLAFGAIAAFMLARRLRAQAGVPVRARVIYADTGAWAKVEKPLFSQRYLLTGKPDYLVELDGARIPIEVKPNRVASEPRWSDSLQLAAYGLLVEDVLGTAPPYGLLKYRDAVFQIEFTAELRAQLSEVLDEMRAALTAADVARSHDDAGRCRGCGYRGECGQMVT